MQQHFVGDNDDASPACHCKTEGDEGNEDGLSVTGWDIEQLTVHVISNGGKKCFGTVLLPVAKIDGFILEKLDHIFVQNVLHLLSPFGFGQVRTLLLEVVIEFVGEIFVLYFGSVGVESL